MAGHPVLHNFLDNFLLDVELKTCLWEHGKRNHWLIKAAQFSFASKTTFFDPWYKAESTLKIDLRVTPNISWFSRRFTPLTSFSQFLHNAKWWWICKAEVQEFAYRREKIYYSTIYQILHDSLFVVKYGRFL